MKWNHINKPFKKLLSSHGGSTAGRNSKGRITSFHRGGGAKRLQRVVDLKRNTPAEGFVERIDYDPNRSAKLALVRWTKGVHPPNNRYGLLFMDDYPFPESEAPFTYPLVAPLGADFYAQDVTIDKAFGFFTRKWFWPFVIKCAFMGTIFYYLVKFLRISWNVGDEYAADVCVCVCTTVFCVGFVWFFHRVNCDSKRNVEEGVKLRINDEGASNVAPLQET